MRIFTGGAMAGKMFAAGAQTLRFYGLQGRSTGPGDSLNLI
ncbi:MAG: hypothetical protein BWY75_03756 [bacterium ADurb.Bin425]|nr:MAG: hypothetical protein BWY75_03756 [bacterium ADurb.Bin425]